jgi:hypothetical protein
MKKNQLLKKTKIYFSIAILFFCVSILNVKAQITFEKTFGGVDSEQGYSVQQTSDNGYIIAGFTNSFGTGHHLYLVKTDSIGNTLWYKKICVQDENEYAGRSIQQTNDNGYIIAGYTYNFSTSNKDVFLVKTDSVGDTLWTKTFGGTDYDEGYSVQQTNDNGYIVTGYTKSFGAGAYDVYLIKTDAIGDTLWTKTFGGTAWDKGYSVRQTNDTGYVITGYTKSSGAGGSDVYLIKTDSSANIIWTKTFGGTDQDEGYSVKQTNDNGYIITGFTESFGIGNKDVYIIKTDSVGDTLWTKTFGNPDNDCGESVRQTNDNGYIITGGTQGDMLLIKTDSSGNILWNKTFGGDSADYGYSVQQTNDNGYIISGYTFSFGAGEKDVYLIKTDENGYGCFPSDTYQDQKICMVTVNNEINKNLIIWEKIPDLGIKSFNIYKMSGIDTFNLIANVAFDSSGIFADTSSNPAQHSDTYKISVIDTCDFESDLSPFHKTIYLSITTLSPEGYELNWDQYSGFDFTQYYIYKGTSPDNLSLIDSVTSDLYSWTDTSSYSDTIYYQISVLSPDSCSPDSSAIYDKSVSNIVANISEAINELYKNLKFNIYPNPFKNSTTFTYYLDKTVYTELVIYSYAGKYITTLVKKQQNKGKYSVKWNTSALGSGIYFYTLKVDGIRFVKKAIRIK